MNFDLDHLVSSKQATFRLVVGHNPGDKPEEVGFIVVGPNSDEYQEAAREASIDGVVTAEKRMAAEKDTGVAARPAAGSRANAELVVERTDAANRIVVDRCTVGWFGFRRNEELVEFNRKDLAALLDARPAWRARILNAIETSGNFDGG